MQKPPTKSDEKQNFSSHAESHFKPFEPFVLKKVNALKKMLEVTFGAFP